MVGVLAVLAFRYSGASVGWFLTPIVITGFLNATVITITKNPMDTTSWRVGWLVNFWFPSDFA